MVKINVVAVGKIKESYYADAVKEYAKRLNKFCTLTLTEVAEENYNKVDDALIEKIKETEAERILPHLKGYVYCLAIEGKKYSSEQFSKELKSKIDGGEGVITFVIGASYGLANKIKEKANALMSFSDMTFPHTLFRVMCLEQIYRAFCIACGTQYHK